MASKKNSKLSSEQVIFIAAELKRLEEYKGMSLSDVVKDIKLAELEAQKD